MRRLLYACSAGALLLCLVIAAQWFGEREARQPQTSETSMGAAVERRNCDFVSDHRRSLYGQHVDCYWIEVGDAEVKARLSAAVFRREAGAPDPLVYIAGGPGEAGNSSPEGLEIWDEWLSRTDIGRDFVLLDLRGLSPSAPAWDCADYTRVSRELLNQNLSFAQEIEQTAPVLEDCLVQWQRDLQSQRGPVASLSALSSVGNVHDLGNALHQLGYEQWNYLAVSYGTRVALLAGMLQPEVRRLVLDSPYPLDRGSISDSMLLWVEAFRRYWAWCETSTCPFDEKRFWVLMEQLKRNPIWVEVEDWRTGREEKWLLNDGRLAAALYTAFYSSELTLAVAQALDDFSRGEHARLRELLEVFFNQAFDSGFNSAIYWATECNDNVLDEQSVFEDALSKTGEWQPFFTSDWQYSICQSASFRPRQLPPMQVVTAPTLVAVGALDPITTEAHARSLMQWLPSGYLLVQQDRSHAEFFVERCGQELIPWFLNATADQLAVQWQEKIETCR